MKRCSHCKEWKQFESFGNNRSKHDGFQNQCKACRSKHHYKNRERLNKKSRQYFHDNRAKIIKQNREYSRTEKGQSTKRQSQINYRAKYPEKYAAHTAVTVAVRTGHIQRATSLPCDHCGGKAEQYHHHCGYSVKHKLDVIPLCVPCHALANKNNS